MNNSKTIALCTDTHLWYGSSNYVAKDGRTQLQAASAEIQAALFDSLFDPARDSGQHKTPDLLIHLGDWSCGGGSFNMPFEDFCAVQQAAKEAFCALPCPVYALPGNHDCPAGGDYSFFAQLWGTQPGIGQTVDLPDARLVLLNTHGHSPEQLADAYPGDPISGWVNEREMQRLEEALATAGERPVILFVHQLLMPWVGEPEWQELYQVDNREEVLRLMARYANVRAVFQGHAHMLNLQTCTIGGNACTFVVCPSLIEYPLAWLKLSLTADALAVSLQRLPLPALAQVSRNSGPGQAWRIGRKEWYNFSIALR